MDKIFLYKCSSYICQALQRLCQNQNVCVIVVDNAADLALLLSENTGRSHIFCQLAVVHEIPVMKCLSTIVIFTFVRFFPHTVRITENTYVLSKNCSVELLMNIINDPLVELSKLRRPKYIQSEKAIIRLLGKGLSVSQVSIVLGMENKKVYNIFSNVKRRLNIPRNLIIRLSKFISECNDYCNTMGRN